MSDDFDTDLPGRCGVPDAGRPPAKGPQSQSAPPDFDHKNRGARNRRPPFAALNLSGATADDCADGGGPVSSGSVASPPVVVLSAAHRPDPAAVVAGLQSYWESLCRGRAVPDRSDVEPKGMREALDYAFILERIAPGAARFRLAGRHLVDLMGMELRGMPVCSFLDPASRGRLSDVLETVFKAPQIAHISIASGAGYQRPPLSGRMLFLPLKSDLGDITRALGCLVTTGIVGRGPRRFQLLSDEVFPVIKGGRPMYPSAGGFAEDPQPWRPPARHSAKPDPAGDTPQSRRAQFRIVGDNKDT